MAVSECRHLRYQDYLLPESLCTVCITLSKFTLHKGVIHKQRFKGGGGTEGSPKNFYWQTTLDN